MNNIKRLSCLLPVSSSKLLPSAFLRVLPRGFTSLSQVQTTVQSPRTTSRLLSPAEPLLVQSCRQYKVRTVLKKRCRGCYLEKRFGRLYVECTLKPRHKQMMQQKGLTYFRDDYSTKNWKDAVHWGYLNREHYYKVGDDFSKYNWLHGKLGKTV